MLRGFLTLLCALVSEGSYAAQAKPSEGTWGTSKQDCKDSEGPCSRTTAKGQRLKQYENTCSIYNTKQSGAKWMLSLQCEAKGETHMEALNLTTVDRVTMLLEERRNPAGKTETNKYTRCESFKGGEGKGSSTAPRFKQGTPYTIVRQKLISAGYQPYKGPEADSCINSNGIRIVPEGSCFPEVVSCAGTGEGNCVFTWRRNKKVIRVITYDDPPLFKTY